MALAVAVCFLPLGLMLVEDKNSSLISSSLAPEALAVSLTHCSRVGFMPRTVVMLCNWSCSIKVENSAFTNVFTVSNSNLYDYICPTVPHFFPLCFESSCKDLVFFKVTCILQLLGLTWVSIVPSRDVTLHPQNFQQEQLPKEKTASEESLTPHKLHTASAQALIPHF